MSFGVSRKPGISLLWKGVTRIPCGAIGFDILYLDGSKRVPERDILFLKRPSCCQGAPKLITLENFISWEIRNTGDASFKG